MKQTIKNSKKDTIIFKIAINNEKKCDKRVSLQKLKLIYIYISET